MIPLPYLEDILYIYYTYTKDTLYPKIKKNKYIVYLLSTLHLLGVLQIMFGVFLPRPLLIYNLLYLILILISYFVFDGHCFITLLTNKLSGITRTPLYIKFSTAKITLIMNIIISIIGIINPKYSLYHIIRTS